jgi:hypothetical protein
MPQLVDRHCNYHTQIVSCCNKEHRNTIMFPELIAIDTTRDTIIEDGMLTIVAGLDNKRRNFPSLRAFLPSECQWVLHFLFSYIFSKLLGQGTIRRIKQVSSIVTQLTQHPCANVTQSLLHECNYFFTITIFGRSTLMETSKFTSLSIF